MIKILETFAGIGAQHKAITRINKKYNKKIFEISGTCEWDIWANISYDAIHSNGNKVPKANIVEKIDFLKANTWSRNGSTPINDSSFDRLDSMTIKRLYDSVVKHKNFGSVTTLNGRKIINKIGAIDLLTYSFPCQNLSAAGAFHGANIGMSKKVGSRSGLLWEIERILKDLKKINSLPKYLLLENVKAMLFRNNIKEFNKWIKFLDNLGYKTNTQVLNGLDFGVPQRRERVFALSILNYKGKLNKNGEPEIRYKTKKYRKLSLIINNDKYDFKEYINVTPNNTPSRIRMRNGNPFLLKTKYTRTVTTKQDRHPNAGTVSFPNGIKGKSQYRFITPREALMLMGFDAKDYEKIKKAGIRKEIIYKQAGNSIIVNILESIFDWIAEYENGK